ncbi:MAG: hypothetical protein WCC03_04755 [Candidatus Acidiferrales bacterium]
MAAWEAAEKSKDTDITQALEPGAWNRVTLILSPASGEQIGYLMISIETNVVSLRRQVVN